MKKKYDRAEAIIQQPLLKEDGVRLFYRPNYRFYSLRFKSFVGDLQMIREDLPSDAWFKRRAACIFAMYLFDFAQRKMKKRFVHWRVILSDERRIKSHFFWKWNTKASLLKLQKMNARRFIYLTRHLVKKVALEKFKVAWKRWQYFCEWQRLLIRIRLLFRCWKTVVQSIRHRKFRLYRLGWENWIINHRRSLLLQEDQSTKLVYQIHTHRLRYYLQLWYGAYQKRLRIHRMLYLLSRWSSSHEVYFAFQKWKFLHLFSYKHEGNKNSLRAFKSSPRKPQTMQTRISYQASTGAVVSRRIVTEKRLKTPSKVIVRTPYTGETPKMAMSLRDKIAWRLQQVKKVDAVYTSEEREIQQSHHEYKTHEEFAHMLHLQRQQQSTPVLSSSLTQSQQKRIHGTPILRKSNAQNILSSSSAHQSTLKNETPASVSRALNFNSINTNKQRQNWLTTPTSPQELRYTMTSTIESDGDFGSENVDHKYDYDYKYD